MYSRVFGPRDARYSNDFAEEVDTDEGEDVEVPRVMQQPPRVKKAIKKQQSNNSSNIFKQQLQSLLATPVPIVLNKAALQSKNAFSCGGTHVVKLNSYKDLKNLRHVEEALPEYDMFYPSRNDKIFDKCAVVGNSGSLLEAERGSEIDAHDVVIRFNAGITEGYEQFVGSKTTFRLLNNPDSKQKEAGEITLSTLRDDDIKTWAGQLLQHPTRLESAFCFDPEFLCYSWQWVRNGGHKPSSGLVGMVLALKICRKITTYGFQSSNYFSRTSRPHYYDWERPAKGRERVHPFQREVALYKQLEKFGFIEIVQ